MPTSYTTPPQKNAVRFATAFTIETSLETLPTTPASPKQDLVAEIKRLRGVLGTRSHAERWSIDKRELELDSDKFAKGVTYRFGLS